MTTDEVDVRPHYPSTQKQRELQEMGEEFGGGDSQTMQLSAEQLSMLSELAGVGVAARPDFELADIQPIDLNDTQPILVDADPDEQA